MIFGAALQQRNRSFWHDLAILKLKTFRLQIHTAGGDINPLLMNNDNYHAFTLAHDLLPASMPGTNIADVGIRLRKGG